MADYVVIDFETRSACDLKKAGAFRYAEDPTTSVLCLAFAWPEGDVQLWVPGHPLPLELIAHVRAGRPVIAHNLQFEWAVWHEILVPLGFPAPTIAQCDDTMARARALSLPGALADCAKALRLDVAKDDEGHRIMMQLCRPRTREPLTFWEPDTAPEKFQKLYAYCKTDVLVERELHKILPPLIPAERRLWEIDQRINQRGVFLDVPAIKAAVQVLAEEKAELSARASAATGGACSVAQRDALLEWLRNEGVELASLRKADVAKHLANAEAGGSAAAKEVLALRKEMAKASTAKLTAMLNCVCRDGRARGLFQYHGASTGRWAGRLIQPQNMPRTSKKFGAKEAEDTIDWLRFPGAAAAIRREYGSVMDSLSMSLRSFLRAEHGKKLVAADFSNIEGRVLAWLAGEDWKLEAFRAFDAGHGADLYKLAYSKSFGVPVESVNDDQRQIGKVQELALGFSGGIGSFISMGANYGVVPAEIAKAVRAVTDEETWEGAARRYPKPGTRFHYGLELDDWTGLRVVVDAWRSAHPQTVALWRAAEDAAKAAVLQPGRKFYAGERIYYQMDGDFLLCRLPSGRAISYPYARLKKFPSMRWEMRRDELKYTVKEQAERYATICAESIFGLDDPEACAAKHALERTAEELRIHELPENIEWESSLVYWGVSSKAGSAKKWKQQRAYGGLLVENMTQAVARDCLAEAIVRCEDAGLPIVLHVHDEAVAEVEPLACDKTRFEALIGQLPPWAAGLPIAAAGWEGLRYRK